jgi:hypothetical protein
MRIRIARRRGERFRPTTPRQRLAILAAAIGTTLLIGGAMLAPHVDYLRAKLARAPAPPVAPPPPAPCAPGQTEGCVGGTMGVIVVSPPAAPASR